MDQGKGAGSGASTGFTIIEVMLFLAISGFLLIGILAGTGSGIARQRYNDSVQDLAQKLRAQYAAVVNTQIPVRDSDGGCDTVDPDDLMTGGKISADKLGQYFNPDGSYKGNSGSGSSGRGRTSCVVYGVMMTFGGSNGTAIQTASLIGKDISEVERIVAPEKIEDMSDLRILKTAGVNNLAVFYENFSVKSDGTFNNWECWVRTTNNVGANYNAQWGARIETTKAKNDILHATVLIFRSPKDGAIRTYVMNDAIKYDGKVFDFSTLNSMNGGKGYGLQNEGNGKCNGNIGSDKAGYDLYKKASINNYITEENFVQDDVIICVGSDDLFGLNSQRRMIKIAKDGHNSSAVELIDRDAAGDGSNKNLCN